MSRQGNNGEYHRADPAYRRQMQVVLGITVVVGLALLAALHWWLQELGTNASQGDLAGYEQWLNRLLAGMCLLLAATAAGFAVWLFGMARATRRERRWPPSSMRTSGDVRIRYLTSADSLVTQMSAVAIALAVLAVLLTAWALWLFRIS